MTAVRLSLVIPCYNEAANLKALVERCTDVVRTPGVEVVLVDNGSRDDTPHLLPELLARQAAIRSVRVEQNRGYGHGILSGLRAAHGKILGWTHADLQTDPSDVLRALPYFDGDRDAFVKGSRSGRPASDVVFSIGMSAFETALLRRPFWEVNAQPTVFPREFFETWRNPPHDFALDLYAYYMARAYGLDIHRIPVRFDRRQHGTSHWNLDWRSKLRFIRRTVNFSFELRRDLARGGPRP